MASLGDIFGGRGVSVADAYAELLDIANLKTRPDHSQFLDFAVRTLLRFDIRRRILVCLWLRDWTKNRYLLDLFECDAKAIPPASRKSIEDQLRSRGIDEVTGMSPRAEADAIGKALRGCDAVRCVADDIGATRHVGTYLMKDAGSTPPQRDAVSTHECRVIGALQVWSSSTITEVENQLLQQVARSLSTNLHRHRSRRELVALKRLQEIDDPGGTDVVKWYQTAAAALGDATSADFCLILEPTPQRSLRGVVAWSRTEGFAATPSRFVAGDKSVLRSIFENPHGTVRIADWSDEKERSNVLHTVEYDQTLADAIRGWVGEQNTWMASPLIAREQVLAVILLLNKSRNLPRQFSATDQGILEGVCRYLANLLPAILARRMIENAADTDGNTVTWLGTATAPSDADTAASTLLQTLQTVVPSISGATLWIAPKGFESDGTVKHIGGDTLLEANPSLLQAPTPEVRHVNEPYARGHFFVLRVLGKLEATAHLGVVFAKERLSTHERELLELFVRVFVFHALRTKELLDTELRVVVEMRHNIRAGLHGLSHLTAALNLMEFLKERNYPRVQPLLQKVLKSLRRAHLFAETSRVLLEHSRLLHTGLRKEDLAPRKTSIGSVVRDVNLALQPEMERYKVKVNLVDQIPPNEQVEVDSPLMYIAFFNLIENAIKYSILQLPVQVRIYFAERQWHFEVENTGRHLDAQSKAEIFRPFVRHYDSRLRRARPGTGLGLPTVQLIVAAHGGSVRVESIPGPSREGEPDTARNVFALSVPRWIR